MTRKSLCCFMLVWVWVSFAHAQPSQPRITLQLTNATLRKFIDTVEGTTPYLFDYGGYAEQYLVRHVSVVSATLEETVRQALAGLPLTFRIVTIHGRVKAILRYDPNAADWDSASVAGAGGIAGTGTGATGGAGGSTVAGAFVEQSHKRVYKNLRPDTLSSNYNNGHGHVNAAFNTGAYSKEDQAAIDRVVDRNLMAHLEGQLAGFTAGGPNNPLGYSIRGNNSLLGNNIPLLIWDKFPYAGFYMDINPLDLESAVTLKDAVTSGIWGAYSGNGVLVLTSKAGQYNEPRVLTLTVNATFAGKPSLYYQPRMRSGEYISADSVLFSRGFFDGFAGDKQFALPPAVAELYQVQRGQLDPQSASAAMAAMRQHNVLQDLGRYYYRNSSSREYQLSVEGGSTDNKYYLSGSYVYDPTALVRNRFDRGTVHGSFTHRSDNERFDLNVTGNLAVVSMRVNNTGDVPISYPYASLTDASGRPLAVSYRYNPLFLDTASGSYPADWHYRPLDELNVADNRWKRTNGFLQLAAHYKLRRTLVLETEGRLMLGRSSSYNNYNKDAFFVRDLVNTYSQQRSEMGKNYFLPIPDAGILITSDTNYTAYNIRSQLFFNDTSRSGDLWTALAGMEVSDAETTGQTQRLYGYNGPVSSSPMDLVDYFPIRPGGGQALIPNDAGMLALSNRAVSVFANAAYTWRRGYTIYIGSRLDASNVEGVENSRRWSPFWSVGMARKLEMPRAGARGDAGGLRDVRGLRSEDGHGARGDWPSLLKLRLSFGTSGNVSNRTADLITQYIGNNQYGVPMNGIAAAPDPSLNWEKAFILNTGADFGFLRDSISPRGRIHGSLDVFERWSVNLLSNDTLAPSAGVPAYIGNSAGIISEGAEIELHTVNTRGRLKWTSAVLMNVVRDWVSRAPYLPGSPSAYVSGGFFRTGAPSTAIFAYQWAGLDPKTGDPQGRLGSLVSKSYVDLMTSSSAGLAVSGVWQPVVTTSMLHTFTFGHFAFSARFDMRTGYSFRRPSMDYYQFAMGFSPGNRDYVNRWQISGDERRTAVPSMPTFPEINRDQFYANSSVLVTRADNIRWRDCNLSYEWQPKNKLFKAAIVYAYVNNILLLWKANHDGIDPDAAIFGQMPAMRTYSLGVSVKY